jgi:ATP-binding cassette subfamily F protein 2
MPTFLSDPVRRSSLCVQCLDFFRQSYPNTATFTREVDEWRSFLGRYGVSGKMQTMKIGQLSEGQKSRLVFAMICMGKPNLLLLDEPTNHLDLEAIDALAEVSGVLTTTDPILDKSV